MEVIILVDDNSTDRTNSLKRRYKAPFHFKYLYSPKVWIEPEPKTWGSWEAEGEIVIFFWMQRCWWPRIFFVANPISAL